MYIPYSRHLRVRSPCLKAHATTRALGRTCECLRCLASAISALVVCHNSHAVCLASSQVTPDVLVEIAGKIPSEVIRELWTVINYGSWHPLEVCGCAISRETVIASITIGVVENLWTRHHSEFVEMNVSRQALPSLVHPVSRQS